MNTPTVIALSGFLLAICLESVLLLVFLRVLRTRHPRQWAHAKQPLKWQERTVLSARRTMLYLKDYTFLDSVDRDGIRHCARNRLTMILFYWATVLTGLSLLATLVVWGW
ncbi:MAG TPA: hypothetical protein VGQ93_02920, partial [Lysobacter sp.]|nr:hypothetical protein [Lysobacter sp.]